MHIRPRRAPARRVTIAAIVGAALALTALPVSATSISTVSLEDPALSAQDLAQSLAGAGVTISNVSYTGAPAAAGSFSGGSTALGIASGVVLSTGAVADVVGPNTSGSTTTDFDNPGDADLDALVSGSTWDAAVLTFDFVPTGSTVSFRYVFSSEEYNEYVGSTYNDVFAFFVNGTNCATVGSGDPVSINTINLSSNSGLYRDNESGSIDTELDGLTTVLTCEASVTPNATNHMKLAIADRSDTALDSAVFLEAGSFAANQPPTVDAGGPYAGQTGSAIALDGTVTDPDDTPTVQWTVTGSACTFGDATAVDTTITCTTAGTYTVTLTADDGTNAPVSDTATVTVSDPAGNQPPTVDAGGPYAGQTGSAIALDGTVTDPDDTPTVQWTVTGSACTFGDATAVDTTITCTTAGTYTVTLTADDGTNAPVSDTATVTVSDPPPPPSGSCVDLIAGQHHDVGEVCWSISGGVVTVTVTTVGGWSSHQTHVHVADEVSGVPRTKSGNPVPGQFASKASHEAGTTQAVHHLALPSAADGQWVLAVHADVRGPDGAAEGAWAAGQRFTEKGSWATYVTFGGAS